MSDPVLDPAGDPGTDPDGQPSLPLLADLPAPVLDGFRIITADDLCTRVEAVLREHLPPWAERFGLSPVATWQQVPTVQAIASAQHPANAITSPGLTEPPSSRRGGRYDAAWRVVTAMYDRGPDHRQTARQARAWAAAMRTVVLQHGTLGGLARRTTWAGEDYGVIADGSAARTLAGASVAFDVWVEDTTPPPPRPGADPLAPGLLPQVTSTRTETVLRPAVDRSTALVTRSAVTVRPPTSEA